MFGRNRPSPNSGPKFVRTPDVRPIDFNCKVISLSNLACVAEPCLFRWWSHPPPRRRWCYVQSRISIVILSPVTVLTTSEMVSKFSAGHTALALDCGHPVKYFHLASSDLWRVRSSRSVGIIHALGQYLAIRRCFVDRSNRDEQRCLSNINAGSTNSPTKYQSRRGLLCGR
jgi:hypothetical protein